ncbi:hypothetical protein C9374_005680 [Naegleria lovaniensis]|uniref:Uncharacterized protein n=1 Tax=Naegleria lovaniensis TaxID=51637 RepID=A0AA88KJI4_NAELO|nr:uncharacterized protein C9374_005680 [Naegleria lovaniensis]KAG2381888.1 hypothetical protein C9374_005680 [Naegleria lovaniensis]
MSSACGVALNEYLNEDVFRVVFSFLTIHDLNQIIATGKNHPMPILARDDQFWELYSRQKFGKIRNEIGQLLFNQNEKVLSLIPNIIEREFRKQLVEFVCHVQSEIENNFKKLKNRVCNFKHDAIPNNDHDQRVLSLVTTYVEKEEILNVNNEEIQKEINKHLKKKSKSFKVVIVGSTSVGKTKLVDTLDTGYYSEYMNKGCCSFEYISYVSEQDKSKSCRFNLWDTSGCEDYDRLRPLSYFGADIACVCFNVTNHNSYIAITEKWISEIRQNLPTVPIILVACKTDLRTDTQALNELKYQMLSAPITSELGVELAKRTGCMTYVETSSKKYSGLRELPELFMKIFAITRMQSRNNKSSCQVQ